MKLSNRRDASFAHSKDSLSCPVMPVDFLPADDWTYETVVNVVNNKEFEPASFDYKEVLSADHERDAHNKSIARTVCAMANSGGGFILFGVRDRNRPAATNEERIVGIPLGADLRKQFGDKLVASIQPEITFDISNAIALPMDPSRGLFVCWIPESLLRPHMVRPEGIFYRRTDGGSAEAMDFYQVREQMLFGEERRRKVDILRVEITMLRSQYDLLTTDQQRQTPWESVVRFETNGIRSLVADVGSLLTLDLSRGLLQLCLEGSRVNGYLEQGQYFQLRGSDLPSTVTQGFNDQKARFLQLLTKCEEQMHARWGDVQHAAP